MMKKKGGDLRTVRSQRNEWIPEEFPEGPYGASYHPPAGHRGREDQHVLSAFTYENRTFHEGIPRHLEPDHPTHDSSNEKEAD